jgi:hypothetical protein
LNYDELEHRLIALLDGRLPVSLGLATHLQYLDVAVEDYDVASRELREAAHDWHLVVSQLHSVAERLGCSPGDLVEPADVARGERDALKCPGVRFHYRLDCVYTAARRLLDRIVVLADTGLPPTDTDLGDSHAGFGPRLVRRCGEIGVRVPDRLLAEIDDVNARLKAVRDQIADGPPLSLRAIQSSEELTVETRKGVRVGEEPMPLQFEPAHALRDAILAYLHEIFNLIYTARRPRTRRPGYGRNGY